MMTGGEALARQLQHEGVSRIFTVPGVQLDWAFDGLHRIGRSIATTVPRHEQATSYMADGYARSTGQPGVCMMVPGPGLLNAMAGLSTAYSCSSPVLCISGQIHSKGVGRNYGMLHEIPEQSAALRSVTKWQGFAHTAQEIPGLVRQAFHEMTSGQPRPVAIEVPYDVLAAQADCALVDPSAAAHAAPDAARIEEAAALLSKARMPVIYAGGGVLAGKASAALQALAERLQAPVVMSDNGRGAISDRHPLALTTLGGRAVLPHADVVLVVGSRFMETMAPTPVWTAAQTRFIHLNANADDLGAPRQVDLAIQADARLGLLALEAAVTPATPISAGARAQDMDRVRAWCDEQINALGLLSQWVRALRAAIPEDGILVNELTQAGYLSRVAYPVYAPGTFLSQGYQGTLGSGFAVALGAAVANPGRAVVSITGDGGFGWNLQELATMRKYDINAVVVVFNDGQFGNVRAIQKAEFGYAYDVDLHNPHFRQLAEAFGVPSATVEKPAELQAELARALARGGPTLIEVKVSEMNSPWPLLKLRNAMKQVAPVGPNPLGEPATQRA